MKVQIEPLAIAGDTVVFRWTQSEPNPFQRADSFFFRYADLDLARFSPYLLYEVFLSLQIKVFGAYGKPVELVFPEPIPRPTIDFWTAFHGADDVVVSPVADVASYSPWASAPIAHPRRSQAVFFGGGKDSMLATCLLSELSGADDVVLIQFVGPLRPNTTLAARLERRQEALMLRPARERLGVATQTVWTDFQAQFRPDGYRARPHLELYSAGALPALLAWGASLCTFCIPRSAYPTSRTADGQIRFRYPKSRPEMLATQSDHYRCALGADITVTNLNLLFTTLMAFRMVAERYPQAFQDIVMCTHGEVRERWCYQCWKCGNYAFYGLGLGIVDPRFDYDRFFARSRYFQRIVAYAESGVELSTSGNAPWQPFFSAPTNFASFCHAIANISVDLIADRLSQEAFSNLMMAQALFGNRSFPNVELVPAKAIALLGHETARRIGRLAAEHFEIVEHLPGPFLDGNREVDNNFDITMQTRTATLAHLQ